ncbi:MAG: hypothetical protein ACMZI0_14805 [Symbiopectobacterium sp.]|uniref:hypothetical protein n=1 Tax=Symbiopectobacterium sp. TaxID=2952789 RepID=UPI0039EB0674
MTAADDVALWKMKTMLFAGCRLQVAGNGAREQMGDRLTFDIVCVMPLFGGIDSPIYFLPIN